MGGGGVVTFDTSGRNFTPRRIETGEDLAGELIELGRRHPEAAAMLRELIAAVVAAERAEAGAGLALIGQYRDRWGGDQVLEPEQITEVRAWLASR